MTETCDWQTANQLTDHEVVKCTTVASHSIPKDLGVEFLCLAHADLYKTITGLLPERLE